MQGQNSNYSQVKKKVHQAMFKFVCFSLLFLTTLWFNKGFSVITQNTHLGREVLRKKWLLRPNQAAVNKYAEWDILRRYLLCGNAAAAQPRKTAQPHKQISGHQLSAQLNNNLSYRSIGIISTATIFELAWQDGFWGAISIAQQHLKKIPK